MLKEQEAILRALADEKIYDVYFDNNVSYVINDYDYYDVAALLAEAGYDQYVIRMETSEGVDMDDTDDAYALASAGFGTDEDYGSYGDEW